MSQFTLTELANDRLLVSGPDILGTEGTEVFYLSEYKNAMARVAEKEAIRAYDKSITDFFAPLTKATEELKEARDSVLNPKADPLSYIVIQEAVEHVEAQLATVVELSTRATIVRILLTEPAHHDRLIWVNGQLELTKSNIVTSSTTPSFAPVSEDEKPF